MKKANYMNIIKSNHYNEYLANTFISANLDNSLLIDLYMAEQIKGIVDKVELDNDGDMIEQKLSSNPELILHSRVSLTVDSAIELTIYLMYKLKHVLPHEALENIMQMVLNEDIDNKLEVQNNE